MPELGVEQATPASPNWKATLFLAVVVAVDVALKVFLRWSHYDVVGKLIGVILVANLMLLLWSMFQRNKPGSRVQPDSLLLVSLTSLLLATIAFTQ